MRFLLFGQNRPKTGREKNAPLAVPEMTEPSLSTVAQGLSCA
eukprot:COSAG06_NODE_36680_length_444_cov_0.773913_1_plen_41_part_10